MTDHPRELPFATFLAALRDLRKTGHDMPKVGSFALVAFSPVPLIVLGALFGGLWPWLALAWITVGVFLLDRRLPKPAPDAPEGAEFPGAETLLKALAITHFVVLVLVVGALAGFAGIDGPARLALWLASGLWVGLVVHACAHALIHQTDRKLFALGKWVYISVLYGHHTSAHRLGHHRAVATPDDPATATLGESFWAYAPRAWIGNFRAGYAQEKARQAARNATETGKPGLRRKIARLNPYVLYVLGGSWFVIGAGLFFGWGGMLAYVLLCLCAQTAMLATDYVQHYGLLRWETGPGAFADVTEAHGWDAPATVSGLLLLNAPRASDHHLHPGRPYPALRLGDMTAPGRAILPHSLPAMAGLALMPHRWQREMDHRVLALRKAGQG